MNNPTTSPRRLHPLVAAAIAAVLVASLAATAAITGLFPKASSTSAQDNQTQSAQVGIQSSPPSANQPVIDSAAPANGGAQSQQQSAAPVESQPEQTQPQAQQQTQQVQSAPVQPVSPPAADEAQGGQPAQPAQPGYAQQPTQPPERHAICASCGTVESVVTVHHEGHGSGVGAVAGGLVGGLLGNQFGHGSGRAAMTVLGAVGGGFGGNAVEKHLRSETDYQVRVHMENGHNRYFTYREAPQFQPGEHVRIENGALIAD